MKIDISNIPSNIKHINALDFKKIKIKSSEFDSNFILDESLKKIIYRMIKTCLLDDGIGLAAPQIGVFKQLFIIKDYF
ncbi:MAG: peptide deformylase [Nanoarchaeota archaeon]